MALSSTKTPTAWGDIHVSIGTTGTGDIMATSLVDLGSIDPDNFGIATKDGEVVPLMDINGNLLDQLRKEPQLEVTVSLINPSEETQGKFWTIEEDGTGDARKIKVSSLINNSDYSVVISNPKAIGSKSFEAPKCKINMNLTYDKNKGFGGTCTFTLVKGATGDLFQFGVVAAPSAG